MWVSLLLQHQRNFIATEYSNQTDKLALLVIILGSD